MTQATLLPAQPTVAAKFKPQTTPTTTPPRAEAVQPLQSVPMLTQQRVHSPAVDLSLDEVLVDEVEVVAAASASPLLVGADQQATRAAIAAKDAAQHAAAKPSKAAKPEGTTRCPKQAFSP